MNELTGPELPAGGAGTPRCVHPLYSTGPCDRPARAVRDGLPYCGLHDPLRRTAEGRAAVAAEERGRAVRAALTAAACAGVPDATLDRLARSGGLAAILTAIGELRAAWDRPDPAIDRVGDACRKLAAIGDKEGGDD